MLFIIVLSVFLAGGAGLLVKWILEFKQSEARISWREYAIGMACTPILAVITAYIGWELARSNNMTFSEYLNGWETATSKTSTRCERDGSCRWCYNCDPYIVLVAYSCNCDSKGNCSTCFRPETRYHSCPYVDYEYEYSIQTTLGKYEVAKGVFPENPQLHRWRNSESIPQNVIDVAGTGDPPFWVAVKKRCDSNSPGPVTKKHNYPNYILASERTLMKQYSADIEEYRKQNLLPSLPKDIYATYSANKARFVGFSPIDEAIWQKSLEYLNAALGNQLRGDLMLVIVKSAVISQNPERYALALKAFWQDKTINRQSALPKNTIVTILGTDDEVTVSWSRAFTAMPIGNEKLTVTLRDGLRGVQLNAKTLIGPIGSSRGPMGVHYPPDSNDGSAVLPRILWGLDDPSTKFLRVSMSGKDGKGGFLYLRGEIEPTQGQTWAIAICTLLICLGVWIWAGIHYDPTENSSSFLRTFKNFKTK